MNAEVLYIQPDGTERVIGAIPGDSVMITAVRNGIGGILGQCGGSLSCATCHVFVDDHDAAGFAPISEDEDDMLDVAATDREDNSRLSCQLIVTAGQHIRVTIPKTQL
ncbi:2Fe-2S iron-sulfur cluster-binding protein [Actinoplanes sp. NPDC048796]|uniref:2Fe-2S iron-sulfur cluster-binding protein n=1 Tax=Actinoplanes sp. NPDC048796 TaxID=3155640 RepID=UPI0033CC061E